MKPTIEQVKLDLDFLTHLYKLYTPTWSQDEQHKFVNLLQRQQLTVAVMKRKEEIRLS